MTVNLTDIRRHLLRAQVEVSGTSGEKYRFRLGTGALCQLEETLDLDVQSLFNKLKEGGVRLTMIREFVKVSAVDVPTIDNETANDIIDDIGVVPLLDAMTESIVRTYNIQQQQSPAATKAASKPNGAEANPPAPSPAARRRRGGMATSSVPPSSAN